MIPILKKNRKKELILPKHIAIIMDGNGRWAKKKALPRTAGHTFGASNFKTIAKYCSKIGVKYLTVYAFSTENWKRPEEEVNSLMLLFKEYLKEALSDFQDENIRVKVLGDKSAFSEELQELILNVEEASKNKDGMVLNIAMNYGARSEIIRAVKLLVNEVQSGNISIDSITEEMFSKKMYTEDQPDPDLIIRTGGEYRLSNFLLWQSAYSEYVILNVLWPDFKTKDIDDAIEKYSNRNRRFGGI